MKVQKIFISYRRAQADFVSGALARELRARYGDEQVFRDKEAIGGGEPWMAAIEGAIGGAGSGRCALVVLMGPGWAGLRNDAGRQRLLEPDDPIRLEVAAALKANAVVLPVLLGEAGMPLREELPEDIRAITNYNALQLRDSEWSGDVARLLGVLKRQGFAPRDDVPDGELSMESARLQLPLSVKTSIALALTLVVALLLLVSQDTSPSAFVGAAMLLVPSLVLAGLGWNDARKRRVRGKRLSAVTAGLSGVLVLGCLIAAVTNSIEKNTDVVEEEKGGLHGTMVASAEPSATPAAAPILAAAVQAASTPVVPGPVVPVPAVRAPLITPVAEPKGERVAAAPVALASPAKVTPPLPASKPREALVVRPVITPAPVKLPAATESTRVEDAKVQRPAANVQQAATVVPNTAGTAVAQTARAGTASAEPQKSVSQMCEGRNIVGRSICESRTCKEHPELAQDPVCQRIRAQEDRGPL
jgi:hypothetical protein